MACHRLKKKKGDKTCNVIIRFVNRKRAVQCLQNRKHIRDTIHEYQNLYIHENFCPRYRSIFEECQELKMNNKIKKLWTFNGTVNFKLTDNKNERPKRITHMEDLNKLFPDYYDYETFD